MGTPTVAAMDDIKSGAGTADFAERADRLVRAARTGSLRSPAVVAGLEEAAGRADRERAELVRAWADRLARGVDTEAVRETVLHLAAVAGRGLVDDALAAERRALLDRTAGMWRYQHHYGHPEVLIAAELAAGRMPGPAVIAAFRRTALACAPSEGLRRTLALLTEPVLNVGEPWADSALADPRWHGLLVHARTVKASRPVGAWTRTARDLVAGQGRARRARRSWDGSGWSDGRAASPSRGRRARTGTRTTSTRCGGSPGCSCGCRRSRPGSRCSGDWPEPGGYCLRRCVTC